MHFLIRKVNKPPVRGSSMPRDAPSVPRTSGRRCRRAARVPRVLPTTSMSPGVLPTTHERVGSTPGQLPTTSMAPGSASRDSRTSGQHSRAAHDFHEPWSASQDPQTSGQHFKAAAHDFHGPRSACHDSRANGQHSRAAAYDPRELPATSMGPGVLPSTHGRVGSTPGLLSTT